jgi:transcriptional regulator with XRE-family HTH domain
MLMVTNTNRKRTLSDTVLNARSLKMLTQVEVAAAAGVSSQLVSNVERGELLTLKRATAEKLGAALGVSLMEYVRR